MKMMKKGGRMKIEKSDFQCASSLLDARVWAFVALAGIAFPWRCWVGAGKHSSPLESVTYEDHEYECERACSILSGIQLCTFEMSRGWAVLVVHMG